MKLIKTIDGNEAAASIAYRVNEVCAIYPITPSSTMAALCNNAYAPKDVWGLLKNIHWDCSWRYAANLISDIREDESYIDWYCSGTGFSGTDFTGFVEESYVTEEIESDINSIGWLLTQKKFVDL